MNRDPQRERILAKLYSRANTTATAREYVDPVSGEVLHLTPVEWELLQYDRAHPSDDREPGIGEGAVGHGAVRDGAVRDGAPGDGPGAGRREGARPRVKRRRRSRRSVAIGVALTIAGVLLGIALTIGAVLWQPGLLGLGDRQPVVAPLYEINAVFNSGYYATTDPGAAAAVGFERDSFRQIGDEVVYPRTGQFYAARRDDGQYCLVLVVGFTRAVDTCATGEGIGSNGLSLKDVTRQDDGSLLTFTAQWNRDGRITWMLVDTSH
ncbi:MAG: hypothetical protein ABI310_06145 [Microbacteriaceae bacterium]